jgi:hypothetical protein
VGVPIEVRHRRISNRKSPWFDFFTASLGGRKNHWSSRRMRERLRNATCIVVCCFSTGLAVADEPAAEGAALDAGPYRVISTPARKLSITITYDLPPMQGVVYFPLLPDTASQKVEACKLKVVSGKRTIDDVKAFDVGPQKKPVREVVLKQRIGGQVIVDIDIDLFAAKIEPGNPDKPVSKMTRAERTALTSADWHYEFETAHFRAWMTENALTRAKSERDANFALRVLAFIRRNFVYKIPDPKEMQDQMTRLEIDELGFFIREKATECWGLSRIYTSVLRANGIPSRQMNGYLLEPGATRRGDHHVRAELYLDGTGWVLVEVAGAVSAKNRPLLTFFGHRGDDMLLMGRGVNYQLPGPKGPLRVGTITGIAIGNASGDWSLTSGDWKVKTRD